MQNEPQENSDEVNDLRYDSKSNIFKHHKDDKGSDHMIVCHKWRLWVVLLFGLVSLFSLGIKGYFNAQDRSLKIKSKNIIYREMVQKSPRGSILDHKGRVLAMDMPFYEYSLDMGFLQKQWSDLQAKNNRKKHQPYDFMAYYKHKKIQQAIIQIEKILNIRKKKLSTLLIKNRRLKKTWVIQKKATAQTHAKFQAMKQQLTQQKTKALNIFLKAISVYQYYQRVYPYQNILSTLLGHMRFDNNRTAIDGVEKKLDQQLRGSDRRIAYLKDFHGRPVIMIDDDADRININRGNHVKLTIDYYCQYILNREIHKQFYAHRATSVSALLVEVDSGAIRAVASQPNYNPNNRSERTNDRIRMRALLDYIEAGSVQKPLLIAAGLESGELVKNSTVSVTRTNYFNWRKTPLIERRYDRPTTLTIEEVMKYSINSGIVKFAQRVNKASLWSLYDKLGYGSDYDIFMGERGVSALSHSDSWSDSDYFTRTYGYSEKLNMFNLIAFYLAVARKGVLPPMHLLPKTKNEINTQSVRILSTQTATIVTNMLHQVTTSNGTGRLARVKGIKVAGKTGTARKSGKSTLLYRATFIGFAPLHKPRYVLAVTIDEPRQSEEFYSGGSVAAPLFANIMTHVLRGE